MIALIQRVSHAGVQVNETTIAEINHGILALVGIEREDTTEQQNKLVRKLLHYRVFADEHGLMNLNVQQVEGSLLLVPQFTLAASTQSGLRPSFSSACPPEQAIEKFNSFAKAVKAQYPKVETGQFGANMQVTLTNDGPVTFWLQV